MEMIKQKFRFIAAAGAVVITGALCGGSAQAGVLGGGEAIRAASELGAIVEPVQFVFGGYPYCWYPDGWHGPGWYRCGFAYQVGLGWGGPIGWNNWHHDHDHDHDRVILRFHDHDHHDHDHDHHGDYERR